MGYHPFEKSFEHLLCTRSWIRVMKTHKRIRGPCPQSTWSPVGTQTWKRKCSKLLWAMWWSVYQGTVRPEGKKVKLLKSCPTLCDPLGCSLPHSSVHGIFQARILEWGCHFLLQGIFPTQGSNLGLLCYGQMLYRLSYQGSPTKRKEWPGVARGRAGDSKDFIEGVVYFHCMSRKASLKWEKCLRAQICFIVALATAPLILHFL